ncbi:TIGR03086 family protein [Nocardioides silvaticus]|uniref:TIGR03086 family protein n=1 Tax=Nocardioides silvaticus TaxID=2201891 RepID=A0A316TDJ7_9ACTN|nr:TIGR03086 family metal-binding protein [Nocardioides silvaticus]PWN01561.1 TIGR03086 family protein [Nocardioides silvaticus]
METEEIYRRTVDWWRSCLDGVGDGQWGDPTPCADWNVRELVNHVTGEDLWAGPLLEGRTIEEVGDTFDGDLLGDAPLETARSAADAGVDAVTRLLPQRETVHLSYGEERSEEYVRQLSADHLVHGWDLAAATGGEVRMDPDVVAEVADWFAEREELYRGAGIIGEQGPLDGDPQHDLLARFGRDAGWRPPGS